MKILAIVSIFSAALIASSYGFKILGVFPTMARSHYIVGSALMKGLAEKGHEVTVISPFPQKTPLKNYRDIPTISIIEQSKHFMTNLLDSRKRNTLEIFQTVFDMGVTVTNITLQEKNLHDLLKSKEKFDVVVMEVFVNEAMLGIAHQFNAPVVGLSTFGASLWTCEMVGSPTPLSYVPNPFIGLTDRMSFTQRLTNQLIAGVERAYYSFLYLPRQEELYETYFPNHKPSLSALIKNVSLILLNSHFSLSFPRPYLANMIEVGGMNINRKGKTLPSEIQEFIESAKDGVIYFSMGSNLKSANLPIEKKEAILRVFKSLKQKVLWKWEDETLPGKTDNILINSWFPQDDILAHPNVKLFITHGGLLSVTEATYHGVPIIAIPIFGDQPLNAKRAQSAGIGLSIAFDNLTETSLKYSISEILANGKYADDMKKISTRYRDQPMTPLDTAIYWVEYVARHKGAPHMRSASQDLSFIQYHNLDVFAIIFGVLAFVIYAIKTLFGKLFKESEKPKKNQNKKNKYQ